MLFYYDTFFKVLLKFVNIRLEIISQKKNNIKEIEIDNEVKYRTFETKLKIVCIIFETFFMNK